MHSRYILYQAQNSTWASWPVPILWGSTEANLNSILSCEYDMNEKNEHATIQVSKPVTNLAEMKSTALVLSSKCSFMTIEWIQTAKGTPQILSCRVQMRSEQTSEMKFGWPSTRRRPLYSMSICILLWGRTGPPECLIKPGPNVRSKLAVEANVVHYKKVEDRQIQWSSYEDESWRRRAKDAWRERRCQDWSWARSISQQVLQNDKFWWINVGWAFLSPIPCKTLHWASIRRD